MKPEEFRPGTPVSLTPGQVVITPTDTIQMTTEPMPLRLWTGMTHEGLRCILYIAAIGFPEGQRQAILEVHPLIPRRVVFEDPDPRPPPEAN